MYTLDLGYLGYAIFKFLLGVEIVVSEQLEFPSVYFPSFLFDGK